MGLQLEVRETWFWRRERERWVCGFEREEEGKRDSWVWAAMGDGEENFAEKLVGWQNHSPYKFSTLGVRSIRMARFYKDYGDYNSKVKASLTDKGSVWWGNSGNMPRTKPTALRFYGSSNVIVTGITIQNSPQTHLKFDSCTTVQVYAISVSSPGDSPNTDGIHLQNSQNVVIYGTSIACGDDCVSIQTGCSNVDIHNVNCGPGHGISIGGLGKDNTKACVSNVTVRDITMHDTLTGVRIKTWQGGSGSVQGIMFSNIQVSEVGTPIMIDQYYCDKGKCQNESSAVRVDNVPCTGISLATINLDQAAQESQPFCWNAYGELRTTTVPPIDCLRTGTSSSIGVQSNNIDSC
uniref:Polygalacturonase n=1 Tax=Fagus sylvatica TaxID=28930 RepID=A0A2N9GXD0_FAGSY